MTLTLCYVKLKDLPDWEISYEYCRDLLFLSRSVTPQIGSARGIIDNPYLEPQSLTATVCLKNVKRNEYRK